MLQYCEFDLKSTTQANAASSVLVKSCQGRNEVVREDCQARKLNKEDAMDRCKWREMIKEAR